MREQAPGDARESDDGSRLISELHPKTPWHARCCALESALPGCVFADGTTAITQQEIESLAEEIAEYLAQHPNAADAIDGIMQWWLADPRVGKTRDRVQAALDLLERRGVVTSSVHKDGHVVYAARPSDPRF